MQDLKAKVLFEIEEVHRWKRAIISQHDAEITSQHLRKILYTKKEFCHNLLEIF